MEDLGRSWNIVEDHGISHRNMEENGEAWKITEKHGRS